MQGRAMATAVNRYAVTPPVRLTAFDGRTTAFGESFGKQGGIGLGIAAILATTAGTLTIRNPLVWPPFRQSHQYYPSLSYAPLPSPTLGAKPSARPASRTFALAPVPTSGTERNRPAVLPPSVVAPAALSAVLDRQKRTVAPLAAIVRTAASVEPDVPALTEVRTSSPREPERLIGVRAEPQEPLTISEASSAQLPQSAVLGGIGALSDDDASVGLDYVYSNQARVADVAIQAAMEPPSSETIQPIRVEGGVTFAVQTSINGKSSGRLTLLVLSPNGSQGEYASKEIYLKLSDLISLLSNRMSPELLSDIESSSHADKFITFNDLRSHGVSVSFDHNDRLILKS